MATVRDEMFASPDVFTEAVRANAFPSKLPVHRATTNLAGSVTPPPGLGMACGVGVTDFPRGLFARPTVYPADVFATTSPRR